MAQRKTRKKVASVDYSKVILPCTRKFILKELSKIREELGDITSFEHSDKKRIIDRDSTQDGSAEQNLRNTAERYTRLLEREDFVPKGNNAVRLGNSVKLLIDDSKTGTYIFENTGEGSKRILSTFSSLGRMIAGKKVGFRGTYECDGKSTHTAEILEIGSYEEAKLILKNH
jgi:transcription elongation GreA/GreB family factor